MKLAAAEDVAPPDVADAVEAAQKRLKKAAKDRKARDPIQQAIAQERAHLKASSNARPKSMLLLRLLMLLLLRVLNRMLLRLLLPFQKKSTFWII